MSSKKKWKALWHGTTQHKFFRLWIMMVGVVVCIVAFEEVADDVFLDPGEGDHEAQIFDSSIAQFVSGIRTARLNQIMTDLTALGSVSVIATLFVLFMSIMATYRDYRGIAFITSLMAGAAALPLILKSLFRRARPEPEEWVVQVGDLSFPSGHSFGAAATYIGFAYFARKYARSWHQELFFYFLGIVLALLVGASRIYLGVHFPTDVLAGLSGGIGWALTAACVYEYLYVKRSGQLT